MVFLWGYLRSWNVDRLLHMMKFPDDLLRWCSYLLCRQIHSIPLRNHILSRLSFSLLRHAILANIQSGAVA